MVIIFYFLLTVEETAWVFSDRKFADNLSG